MTNQSFCEAAITSVTQSADERVINRLAEIERLGPNWDGEGAEPLERATVQLARIVWSELLLAAQRRGLPLPVPAIGCFANGTITFLWAKDRGTSLEVSIRSCEAEEIEVYSVRDGHEREEQVESTVAAVDRALIWFT